MAMAVEAVVAIKEVDMEVVMAVPRMVVTMAVEAKVVVMAVVSMDKVDTVNRHCLRYLSVVNLGWEVRINYLQGVKKG